MSLILGALGKLYNFGTKFELFSVIYFWFFAWIIFVWKNEEFWKIYFLTKFVPESIKMNLHTSSTPFWNEISISNLLILSNFWFFGLHCHRCGKHLCRFLCIRLYLSSVLERKISWSFCANLHHYFHQKSLSLLPCIFHTAEFYLVNSSRCLIGLFP